MIKSSLSEKPVRNHYHECGAISYIFQIKLAPCTEFVSSFILYIPYVSDFHPQNIPSVLRAECTFYALISVCFSFWR